MNEQIAVQQLMRASGADELPWPERDAKLREICAIVAKLIVEMETAFGA